MRDDVQATVCGNDVHQMTRCRRWCDAAYRTTSQFGSPFPPPTEAKGAETVPWDHIQVTGDLAMIAKPVPMIQRRADVSFTAYQDVPLESTERAIEVQRAEEGVRSLLRLMGEDPERDGIRDTPKRVVKAYLEMASRPGDPAELLSRVFGDVGQSSEMICVPGIRFVSLCEHHLLPFTGTAAVAYIPRPGGSVVGLSKIPRLVHHWAMRPQVQERLTRQIADSLEEHLTHVEHPDNPQRKRSLPPLGVAVRIDSTHSCMSLRGVKADAASMVTTDLRGRFLEGAPRAEFLSEAQR